MTLFLGNGSYPVGIFGVSVQFLSTDGAFCYW